MMADYPHHTHQVIALNPHGRDFVCGDLHGMYDELIVKLSDQQFNPLTDRLFALGDLIDRGYDSLKCLRLLKEPWFFSIKGNHEMLLYDALGGSKQFWFDCGGDWYDRLSRQAKKEVQQLCVDYVYHLPLSMTLVDENGYTLGLAHADVPGEWHDVQQGRVVIDDMLWGRTRLEDHIEDIVSNVDAVLVGHSSVNEIYQLGNVFYVDTAAGFVGGYLTLIEITEDIPKFINDLSIDARFDNAEFNARSILARDEGQALPGFILEPVNPNPLLQKREVHMNKISLCLDLEASCFEGCKLSDMGCIEIGVIALDEEGKELSRFQSYIQPQFTELTEFCTSITGITEEILATAPKLGEATRMLQEWLASLPTPPVCYYSWGDYDRRQLDQDFKRLNITNPLPSQNNAKILFQKKNLKGSKRVGMAKALSLKGMAFEGKPHSAIDDAHNLARLFPFYSKSVLSSSYGDSNNE